MGKNIGIRLVVDRKTKPARTYAGAPIKCKKCGNRNLIETFSPRFRDGREIRGKRTGWACIYCGSIEPS